MIECFPPYEFFAKPLNGLQSEDKQIGCFEVKDALLTRMIFCKSLFSYIFNTFTATVCPWYSHFHTSPNAPWHCATPVRLSPNSIRNELGSSSRLAHVLYNSFRQPARTFGSKSSNAYRNAEGQSRHLSGIRTTFHLIDYVDECLGITF